MKSVKRPQINLSFVQRNVGNDQNIHSAIQLETMTNTETAHCYTIVLLSPILSTSWKRKKDTSISAQKKNMEKKQDVFIVLKLLY